MEMLLFIGIQGAGKTTFYQQRFFNTHFRISVDLLKTRRCEGLTLTACLSAGQRFVVDNTNPIVEERAKYIQLAKKPQFRVIGYFFEPDIGGSNWKYIQNLALPFCMINVQLISDIFR